MSQAVIGRDGGGAQSLVDELGEYNDAVAWSVVPAMRSDDAQVGRGGATIDLSFPS